MRLGSGSGQPPAGSPSGRPGGKPDVGGDPGIAPGAGPVPGAVPTPGVDTGADAPGAFGDEESWPFPCTLSKPSATTVRAWTTVGTPMAITGTFNVCRVMPNRLL